MSAPRPRHVQAALDLEVDESKPVELRAFALYEKVRDLLLTAPDPVYAIATYIGEETQRVNALADELHAVRAELRTMVDLWKRGQRLAGVAS